MTETVVVLGSKPTLRCPGCEAPLAEVDPSAGRVRCGRCGLELTLPGYLEPPGGLSAQDLSPQDLERPKGLRLRRGAAPGVEIFRLGGALDGGQLRFERGALVFKGFLGRERSTPLDEIEGFAALQHLAPSGELLWEVVAVRRESGHLQRLWAFPARDHARYLASELNRTLGELRR